VNLKNSNNESLRSDDIIIENEKENIRNTLYLSKGNKKSSRVLFTKNKNNKAEEKSAA